MANIIEFETKRLYLRQWKACNLLPFAVMNADPRVMAFFPGCLSRSESDAFAMRCRDLIEARGWGFWAVEIKETRQFVGFVGLHIPIASLPFSPCVEIGWRLAYEAWGHGFATEAAQGALSIGFERLHLTEIVSFTAVGNFRSRAVMDRLGMRYDSDFEHPSLPIDSALRLHCLYRIDAGGGLFN